MRFLIRLVVLLLGLGLLFVGSLFLFADPIFRSLLERSFTGMRDTHGLQITFEDASLSPFGKVEIFGLEIVELSSRQRVLKLEKGTASFSWLDLLVSPRMIQRVSLEKPEVRLSPAVLEKLKSSGTGIEPHQPPPLETGMLDKNPATSEEKVPSPFLLAELLLRQGLFEYSESPTAEPFVACLVNASAENLSTSVPIEFQANLVFQAPSTGSVSCAGKVDPSSFDCRVDLLIDSLAIPGPVTGETLLPNTDGRLTVLIEDELSHIRTEGHLTLQEAPSVIPTEILETGPLRMDWNLETEVTDPAAGSIELKQFLVSVEGLKGGTRRLAGKGSYNRSTAQGTLSVRGKDFPVALLNPFLEPGTRMGVRKGRAAIDLSASRAGQGKPFELKSTVRIDDLKIEGTEQGTSPFEFQSIRLDLDSFYSPENDELLVRTLSLGVDGIPVVLTGTVSGLTQESKRNLNIRVEGKNLDLGRLVVLFAPSINRTGALSGKASLGLQVRGDASSGRLPDLTGGVDLNRVSFVPREAPEMKVTITGHLSFDSSTISGKDLSLELAKTPGKVDVVIQRYNKPRKEIVASVRGIAIEPLVNLLSPESSGYLTGNLDGTLKSSITEEARPENLAIDFTIEKGVLFKKNPIPQSVADTVGWAFLKGNYALTEAYGKVLQEDETIRISELVLVGKEGGIRAKADLTPDGGVDFEVETVRTKKGLQGSIRAGGHLNTRTLDANLQVALSDLTYPTEKGPLPPANGKVSVVLKRSLSQVQSTGLIRMAKVPPTLPKGMGAGTPFELEWRADASLGSGGKSAADVRSLEVAIRGLKGGEQRVSLKGNYDPESLTGSFTAQARRVSLPLLNPFLETSAQTRILSGKADLNLNGSKKNPKEAFGVQGKVQIAKLALKDLSGKRSNLKFDSIGVDLAAVYDPQQDLLNVKNLAAALDGIPLKVSGRITNLQDEKKRTVDLNITGKELEVGKLIHDFSPSFKETGTVAGKVDVDLNVSGRTSSDKFPILVGSLSTEAMQMIPKKSPASVVKVRGKVLFDSEDLKAQGIDVKLAGVPGKVSVFVKGYNEPIRRVNAQFRGLAIEPLVKIYKPAASGIVVGRLNGEVKAVLGQRDRPEALDIEFTIDEGKLLTRHPIPRMIVDIVQWQWLRGGIDLTNAKGKIYQDTRGYVIDRLFLMGDRGGITARGRVGFDNRLAVEVRLNVARSAADELPGFIRKALRAREGSAWAYLGFDITGTLEKPTPRPQFDALVDVGIRTLREKLQEKYGEKIPGGAGEENGELIEGAGRLLEGLFKKK